jgi:hypothetical protein
MGPVRNSSDGGAPPYPWNQIRWSTLTCGESIAGFLGEPRVVLDRSFGCGPAHSMSNHPLTWDVAIVWPRERWLRHNRALRVA